MYLILTTGPCFPFKQEVPVERGPGLAILTFSCQSTTRAKTTDKQHAAFLGLVLETLFNFCIKLQLKALESDILVCCGDILVSREDDFEWFSWDFEAYSLPSVLDTTMSHGQTTPKFAFHTSQV